MLKHDKETVELECPGCKRTFEATYYDIYGRREAKCRRCSSSYKFDSSAAHNVQNALQDLERAEDKLKKSMQELYKKADVVIKK